MTDFLEQIPETVDNNVKVLILIDVSGSTDSKLKNKKTIRDYEFNIARQLVQKYGQAEIICWSDNAFTLGTVDLQYLITNEEEINKKCKKFSSGTNLMSGFNLIDLTKYNKDDAIHLLVLTDGEISDSSKEIGKKLSEYSDAKNIIMKIFAFETGSKNYLMNQCDVGNALYRMVQENGMTRLVNKFLIYNELETEFTNFSNPIVPEGYIPFRDQMFLRADFGKFIQYIVKLVDEIKVDDPVNTTPYPVVVVEPSAPHKYTNTYEFYDGEELEDHGLSDEEVEDVKVEETNTELKEQEKLKEAKAKEDKMRYLKLAHEVSLSLYHMTKDRQYHEQVSWLTCLPICLVASLEYMKMSGS